MLSQFSFRFFSNSRFFIRFCHKRIFTPRSFYFILMIYSFKVAVNPCYLRQIFENIGAELVKKGPNLDLHMIFFWTELRRPSRVTVILRSCGKSCLNFLYELIILLPTCILTNRREAYSFNPSQRCFCDFQRSCKFFVFLQMYVIFYILLPALKSRAEKQQFHINSQGRGWSDLFIFFSIKKRK